MNPIICKIKKALDNGNFLLHTSIIGSNHIEIFDGEDTYKINVEKINKSMANRAVSEKYIITTIGARLNSFNLLKDKWTTISMGPNILFSGLDDRESMILQCKELNYDQIKMLVDMSEYMDISDTDIDDISKYDLNNRCISYIKNRNIREVVAAIYGALSTNTKFRLAQDMSCSDNYRSGYIYIIENNSIYRDKRCFKITISVISR